MNKTSSHVLLLTTLLCGFAGNAYATDPALLRVLLENKLITQAQYDAIQQAEAKPAPVPDTPQADRRLPVQRVRDSS